MIDNQVLSICKLYIQTTQMLLLKSCLNVWRLLWSIWGSSSLTRLTGYGFEPPEAGDISFLDLNEIRLYFTLWDWYRIHRFFWSHSFCLRNRWHLWGEKASTQIQEAPQTVPDALIIAMDYCNVLYILWSLKTLGKLQLAQNTVAYAIFKDYF